ncbi:hypothetical protein OIU74_004922 [Salix koriyanagi]|uniref:Uncharacterized protein n=1 Tax=Salix koriyanagi TaxID=2511006 RepID=A0A9Q0ZG18_9ROSI|nr:hypothetical protein OIU74_004922 [Salix koriyanagi]
MGLYQGDSERKPQQGFYLAPFLLLKLCCPQPLEVLLGLCGNVKIGSEMVAVVIKAVVGIGLPSSGFATTWP